MAAQDGTESALYAVFAVPLMYGERPFVHQLRGFL